MPKSLNRCTFIGRLILNPEASQLGDGTATTHFVIAVDDEVKDRASGRKTTRATLVPIVGQGKVADVCNKLLKKDSDVYVEGRLAFQRVDQGAGAAYMAAEVILENMQRLGGHSAHDGPAAPGSTTD